MKANQSGVNTKQMGYAGEMLVAAELTLHGVPAFLAPENWPHYDVLADHPEKGLQRISVKTRTFATSGNFVAYNSSDEFDWLAIVILPNEGCETRRFFVVPRKVAERRSYEANYREGRGFFVNRLMAFPPCPLPEGAPDTGGWGLADYENNFDLSLDPRHMPEAAPVG